MYFYEHLNPGFKYLEWLLIIKIFRLKYLEWLFKQPTEYELTLGEIVQNKNNRLRCVGTVFEDVPLNAWGLTEGNIGIHYILLLRGWLAQSPSSTWPHSTWNDVYQRTCYSCSNDLKDMYGWT